MGISSFIALGGAVKGKEGRGSVRKQQSPLPGTGGALRSAVIVKFPTAEVEEDPDQTQKPWEGARRSRQGL